MCNEGLSIQSDFPSGPPPNYQLNPVISNPLPPGSNLNYNTNRQSFSQGCIHNGFQQLDIICIFDG
jgi:hypothetical protein